jgi:WD40 repeat protein
MAATALLSNVRTIDAHSEHIYCVSFSPDGTLLATGCESDSVIKLWGVRDWKEKRHLRTLSRGIHSARFLAGGRQLIAGTSDATWLFDVRTGSALDYFEEASSSRSIPLPDGRRFVSCGHDRRLRLWEVGSQAAVFESKKLNGWVGSLETSPDGRHCAVATGGAVGLWDLDALAQVHLLRGHRRPVHGLAFSPASRTLASGGEDWKVVFWDVSSGSLTGTIELERGQVVSSLAYLDGGNALAVASGSHGAGGRISVWDARRCRLLAEVESESNPTAIAATPDGRWIAAANERGQVEVWFRSTAGPG